MGDDLERLRREAQVFLHKIEGTRSPWAILGVSGWMTPTQGIEGAYRRLKTQWNRDSIRSFRDPELTGYYVLINERLDAAYAETKERSGNAETSGLAEIHGTYERLRKSGKDHPAAWSRAVEKYREQNRPRDSYEEYERVSALFPTSSYDNFREATERLQQQFDRSMELLEVDPAIAFRDSIATELRSLYAKALADEEARDFARSPFSACIQAADHAMRMVGRERPQTVYLGEIFERVQKEVVSEFIERVARPALRQVDFLSVRGLYSYSEIPLALKLEAIAELRSKGGLQIEVLVEHLEILAFAARHENVEPYLPALLRDIEAYASPRLATDRLVRSSLRICGAKFPIGIGKWKNFLRWSKEP